MRPGARLAAAIDILSDMETRKRPAAEAVKDWMLSHRFAGSKDRAEIGDLVFAALRWRQSSAWRMGSETARAIALGALRWGFAQAVADIEQTLLDDPHAPPALSDAERLRMTTGSLDGAPAWVAGDYPEWLEPSFVRAFGDDRADEGAALAAPAPLDLRVNALKASRERVLADLSESPRLKSEARPCPHAPLGVRIAWRRGGAFPFATEPAFVKGWFEVQDEGSQLAAMLAQARPGQQVADICAGGGGKTLALAADMDNKGQIYAFDVDGRRMADLPERLERAGVRNAQIRTPRRSGGELSDLEGRMDLVLVDAPCTGSGTWRRAPDAKWRVRPTSLETRRREQAEALDMAATLVKPGGRMVYITCSVLPEENEDAVTAFLEREPQYTAAGPSPPTAPHRRRAVGVQFTPLRTGTDGFYVAELRRR